MILPASLLPLQWSLVLPVVLSTGCVLILAGCGPHIPHSGKPKGGITVFVTNGGVPISEGYVNLEDRTTGHGGGGELNSQGVVTLPGVVAGNYVVTVIPPIFDSPPPQNDQTEEITPSAMEKLIPKKFRGTKTSPLRAEIKEGISAEYRFDLKE